VKRVEDGIVCLDEFAKMVQERAELEKKVVLCVCVCVCVLGAASLFAERHKAMGRILLGSFYSLSVGREGFHGGELCPERSCWETTTADKVVQHAKSLLDWAHRWDTRLEKAPSFKVDCSVLTVCVCGSEFLLFGFKFRGSR
jgi:hypothetical protein